MQVFCFQLVQLLLLLCIRSQESQKYKGTQSQSETDEYPHAVWHECCQSTQDVWIFQQRQQLQQQQFQQQQQQQQKQNTSSHSKSTSSSSTSSSSNSRTSNSRVRLYGGGSGDAVEQSQPMTPPSKQSLEVSSPQEQSLATLPAASPPSKQSLAVSSPQGQSKTQWNTRLSPPEKEQRVQLTWQSIDRAIWTAAFADDTTLQQHCPDAVQWRQQLESTTIVMWDHVPVCLKCTGNSVTLILFQAVEQWFSPSAVPRGFAGIRSWNSSLPDLQGIIIIHGSVQCRLEDLDDSGRFNKDYRFHAKDKQFDRWKGQKAGGLLKHWVQLRSELGHEQFLKLRVWSQPAACADEVVEHTATHQVSTIVQWWI
jgi:hypothetical protein